MSVDPSNILDITFEPVDRGPKPPTAEQREALRREIAAMSTEQELPRPGSVWRKGDEWRRVRKVLSGDWVTWRTFERFDEHCSTSRWLAWAAGAECVCEGEGE